jgi:hypothetical protein
MLGMNMSHALDLFKQAAAQRAKLVLAQEFFERFAVRHLVC